MGHARWIMEGQPSVSYTAGSMNSLVEKLTKLKNLPLAIQRLKQDLVSLQEDFFHKVSGRRDTNWQVEAWMKIVRELAFDIEDWLDQKPNMGDQQLEIEDEVKSFKARVEHACELCQRYDLVVEEPTDLHDHFAVPSKAAVDSQVLFEEKTGLVGMEDQTNELVKLLEGEQKMLKVVSIVGFEGLGKTTLGKEIYTKLHGKFDCHAFVSVGRRPLSMRAILMDILHQVKSTHKMKAKPKTNISHRGGRKEGKYLQKVITDLWEFLCKKRYFILVDGLWSTRAWNIINCALPNENQGSRVLITTCISDVAKCCSVRPTDIYQMEALSEMMSRRLYQERTRVDPWPHDYDEATRSMLKICSGMPLAIIVTAGLLAMKSEEVTESNIHSSLEHCSASEGMMKLLHMSYDALSLPLKSCFLYLSVFREDYTIKKDRLIRLWVAEGFIPMEDKERRGGETTRDENKRKEETRVENTTREEKARNEETKRGEEITIDEKTTGGEETRDEKTRGEETTRGEEITRYEETKGAETTRGEETRDKNKDGKTTKSEETPDKIPIGEETREEKIRTVEKSLWETGERYFNELIKRRLIQPVFDYSDDQAVGCTVHGVILDFTKSLSSRGNFVTVGVDLSFGGSTDTVRRLTLDCYNDEDGDGDGTLASIAVQLSRVRSVTILGDIEGTGGRSALTASGKIKGTPVLPSFRLIRVLDLEDTDHLGRHHLEGIGGLVLLKHLGVAGTDIHKLPEEIGKLEQLETLDLSYTKLSILPASIAKQKSLAHLLIDPTVKLPTDILEMQGLEEVSTIGIDSSRSIGSVAELLRKSERLRVLSVRLDGTGLSDRKSVSTFLRHAKGLFGQVASSTELRSLSLDCVHGDLLDLLLEYPPSDKLRRFALTISDHLLNGTAQKMASLVSVTHIDIEIVQLEDGAVRVLGGLPNVVLLKLVSSGIKDSQSKKVMNGRCTVSRDHCFKRLKVFSLKYQFGGTELEFTPGAMPELQRLSLGFSPRATLSLYGDFGFGIEHLHSLTGVHATINCKSATASGVKDAQDAIMEQLRNFSIVPKTKFSTINQDLMLNANKANKTASKVEGRVRTAEDGIAHKKVTSASNIMLTDQAKKTTFPKNLYNGCMPNCRGCLA